MLPVLLFVPFYIAVSLSNLIVLLYGFILVLLIIEGVAAVLSVVFVATDVLFYDREKKEKEARQAGIREEKERSARGNFFEEFYASGFHSKTGDLVQRGSLAYGEGAEAYRQKMRNLRDAQVMKVYTEDI